jgi:hypothetical protein
MGFQSLKRWHGLADDFGDIATFAPRRPMNQLPIALQVAQGSNPLSSNGFSWASTISLLLSIAARAVIAFP